MSIRLLLCCALLAACSSPTPAASGGVPKCVPGKTDSCACPGGGSGVQTCSAEGVWASCACQNALTDATNVDVADGSSGQVSDVPNTASDTPTGGFGDGIAVGSDVPAGLDATEHCVPCEYGALKGLVCAPNDQIYVSDATVTLTVIDCDGQVKQLSTVTDSDGSYYFPKVPCGKHEALVESGSFKAQYNVFIKPGQQRDLTGIGQKLCFLADSTKIAVFWGQWDEQHDLLDKLGLQYTYYNFSAEYFNDAIQPKDIEAVQVLRDPTKLSKFDVIFFNCGSAAQKYVNQFPEIAKNLKAFVLAGGSLYASDLAWAYVEAAFPDAIDFFGSNELPSAPTNDGPQEAAGNQKFAATIVNNALAKYVGVTTFQAKYGPGPLIVVDKAGPGTTVHVTGIPQVTNKNKKSVFDPDTLAYPSPMVLTHQPPGQPKAGRVIYTTFHNDEQTDAVMLKILNYLVFKL